MWRQVGSRYDPRPLGLGVLAGAATIVGAVIDNAELSAFLLGIGVGAIVQVVVQIAPALRDHARRYLDHATIRGVPARSSLSDVPF
ncbi:hypothetical protein FHU38_002992 [Saccharomonospora amisosensis]|uniref:Uncharacterized protein n=1 Tax=Saccharomonospora amisosensis TaxID=1128677 RepID=A0A7X5UR22_9PSEU|nr:hypothetical protein [Saccharomonospora amisosensis]NIJ12648.1 hypothetical protein [Saccharomonospora amisosensis]